MCVYGGKEKHHSRYWELKHAHKNHGSGSFAQPEVLQSVLFVLVFPLTSLHLGLRLWGAGGWREGVSWAARSRTGAEERLGGEGLQGLLTLLASLRQETRHHTSPRTPEAYARVALRRRMDDKKMQTIKGTTMVFFTKRMKTNKNYLVLWNHPFLLLFNKQFKNKTILSLRLSEIIIPYFKHNHLCED